MPGTPGIHASGGMSIAVALHRRKGAGDPSLEPAVLLRISRGALTDPGKAQIQWIEVKGGQGAIEDIHQSQGIEKDHTTEAESLHALALPSGTVDDVVDETAVHLEVATGTNKIREAVADASRRSRPKKHPEIAA